MTLASRLHWRLLVGTILVLMAAAWLAPLWVRAPDIQENRVLAAAPRWPPRHGLKAYRLRADAYVADHFPARPHLIGLLNRLRMLAGVSGSSSVIVGRDGWLFYDDKTHLGAARGDVQMPGPEVRRWLGALAGRTEYLQARGGTYLVVVPPVKEVIYPQHGPVWYHGPDADRLALALPRLAQASGAGEVVYLYDPVARATRAGQKTYSLHDTHWTSYGAYAAYVALMDRLHAKGLTEGPRPLSDFQRVDLGRRGPRDMALMLGVSSFVDLDYPHFDDHAAEARKRTTFLGPKTDWTAPQVVDTGQVGKPVLLLNRDSFSNEILPFMLSHFSRIVLAHNQDGFWRQDLVDRFRPGIAIMEVIEPGLRVSLDENDSPSPKPSQAAQVRIDHVLGTAGLASAAPVMPNLTPPDAATAAAIAAAKPAANCHLEIATLTPGQNGEASFTGSGWISELIPKPTSPMGFMSLTGPRGVLVGPVRADIPRPDVASAYKNPGGRLSGFVGAYFVRSLAPGVYTPAVYRRAGAGWITCKGDQQLVAP